MAVYLLVGGVKLLQLTLEVLLSLVFIALTDDLNSLFGWRFCARLPDNRFFDLNGRLDGFKGLRRTHNDRF